MEESLLKARNVCTRDGVSKDGERLEWLMRKVSGAEFRRLGVTYGGNCERDSIDAAMMRAVLDNRESDNQEEIDLSQICITEITAEVARATAKFPTWPTDPLHALAVLGEEFGELTKAMLQHIYEPHKGVTQQEIHEEAIQTAAMALRLAMSLDRYEYWRSEQHSQSSKGSIFALVKNVLRNGD